ncbi:MAG: phosphoadenosine phosphosulfate reductase family protein, partial [archaeon]
MREGFPDYVDVDYTAGEGGSADDFPSMEAKIEQAIDVVRTGLEEYEQPAVMWTGGKDSTLVLYFVREVATEFGYEMPPAVFIDHFQHFEELLDFVDRWASKWNVDVHVARNDDVGALAEEPGDEIR